ncbi:nuclear transport factor 2 family protein [Sphingomonas flavalba]|uniref:nuclear transport factor 2 family protein n=1 Tax=Sphingomonas flavalba TaxID=2559804 RepID=UPI0039E02426
MTHAVTEAAFAAWLDGYKAAWEGRDPEAAAALFTPDARYHETPYDPPLEGQAGVRAYWEKVTAGQAGVVFTYDGVTCTGDTGLCHWHAAFKGVPGGEAIDLDGMFRCRFAADGRVDRLEEWWHIQVVPSAA